MKNELLDAAFEVWWAAEIAPVIAFADATASRPAHGLCRIAWSNGAHKAVALNLSLDDI